MSLTSGGAGGIPGLSGAGRGVGAPVSFPPTASLCMLCSAILARKAAVSLILQNHCLVSFYRSHHLVMPGNHNTLLRLFSNFGPWFLDLMMRFLSCRAREPFFSHFSHIQGKTHVGLFKLYPPSLSCHSSCHVENLQEISCCF